MHYLNYYFMKLNESSKSFEENYILPNVKLRNNSSNFNKYDNHVESSKKKLNNSKSLIGEIKQLLKDMKKSPIRTTNFSIILYLVEKNYKRLPVESIIKILENDFSKKPQMFINTTKNQPFEDERKFINSLNCSIRRNKSFKIETVKEKKYISLNEIHALEYLKKMYGKYTRKNVDNDITSLTSFESKKSQLDKKPNIINKKAKLIGNKTLRNQLISDDESENEDEDEESFISNIKPSYTKLNLNETNSKKSRSTSRRRGRNIRKEDIWDKKSNHSSIICHNKNDSFSSLEFDNFLSSLEKTTQIYSLFLEKFNEIKSLLQEKEKALEKYNNSKDNLEMHKKEISPLMEIMTLKLGMIHSYKSSKYYDQILKGCKYMVPKYKNLFDNAVKEIKNIYSLEKEINAKREQISIKIKEINEIEDGGVKGNISIMEIKEDIKKWMKKLINENKNINEINNDNINDISNIEELENQFNNYINEINHEKGEEE